MEDFWLKQTLDQPAFPDVMWSRPENKRHAGKLLIIGGQAQSLLAPSAAFASAGPAGIGAAKVLLPDSTQKILGKTFAEAEFAPSTVSGSFGREALALWLDLAEWADGVLLAGDLGKNSETAILIEQFVKKFSGQLTLVGDSLDYFVDSAEQILDRKQTSIIASFSQLQKLLAGRVLLKHSMSLAQLVEALSESPAQLLTHYEGQIIVAVDGKVCTTPASAEPEFAKLAAYASVWLLQQSAKPFEALCSAVYDYFS